METEAQFADGSPRARGAALYRQGQYAEAVMALREATAAAPSDEAGWRLLGASLSASGDPAGAVAAFEKAVSLDPGSARGRYNLALALEAVGQNDSARRQLQEALRIDPTYAAAREQLAAWEAPSAAAAAGPTVSLSPPPVPAARLALGILASLVAGALGTTAWLLFIAMTRINLSLLAIGVGWLIGKAALLGCGRGGQVPAVLAAVVAVLFIGGFTALDYFGGDKGLWSSIFGLLCFFWGVQQAYTTPMRAPG